MATSVTEEMLSSAAADLKKKNEEWNKPELRTFVRGAAQKLYVSDLFLLPEEFSVANLAPVSYLAQPDQEVTGSLETQKFSLVEERLKGLTFDQPAREIQRGARLAVVKALKPNGVLAQLPLSRSHNNAVAGDDEDLIGLRLYERKGFILLLHPESGLPIYCLTRNCWAASMVPQLGEMFPEHMSVVNTGYCSYEHMTFVEPNRARDASYIGGGGMFAAGATTSRNARRG